MEVIAGLSAIIGISGTAMQWSKDLYKVAYDIKYAREEVQYFANDVAMFASALQTAKQSLDRQSAKPSAAAIINGMRGLKRLIRLVTSQSRSINQRIKNTFAQLDNMAFNLDFLGRFKWLFQKTEVKWLSAQMSNVQITLNLVVASVTLELGGTGLSRQER